MLPRKTIIFEPIKHDQLMLRSEVEPETRACLQTVELNVT